MIKDVIKFATDGKGAPGRNFWINIHFAEQGRCVQIFGNIDGFSQEGDSLTLISPVVKSEVLGEIWRLCCDVSLQAKAQDKVQWKIFSLTIRPDGQSFDPNSGRFIPVEIAFYDDDRPPQVVNFH